MEGARLYLEAEIDKDNSNMREVKIHFCDFIRIMIKNFSCKYFIHLVVLLITMYHYQSILCLKNEFNHVIIYTLYQWKRATLYYQGI
jgi:hypothetical protein